MLEIFKRSNWLHDDKPYVIVLSLVTEPALRKIRIAGPAIHIGFYFPCPEKEQKIWNKISLELVQLQSDEA